MCMDPHGRLVLWCGCYVTMLCLCEGMNKRTIHNNINPPKRLLQKQQGSHNTTRGEEEMECMGEMTWQLSSKGTTFLVVLPYKYFLSIFDLGGPFNISSCFLRKVHLHYVTFGGKPLFTSFMNRAYSPPWESPMSILHSLVQAFFFSWVMKATYVNLMVVTLVIAREPHALIVGKSMWQLEDSVLRLRGNKMVRG